MKRLFALFSVILALLLAGCNTAKPTQTAEKGDFKFCSLKWGTDWETVQKSKYLQNADCEVTQNGQRQLVQLKNFKYSGVELEMVGLAFDIGEESETKGLHSVFLQFSEDDEETLLTEFKRLYGERKSTYLDKNGVEIPITPAGWVSSETIETVLTQEEKEFYISMFPADYEKTRLDANLRSPLVSIRFDEERNLIEFNGNDAAIVSYIQAEMKK